MEKFIFDLDGTLMNADFELESKLLSEMFSSSDEASKVIPYKVKLIEDYERLFPRYDIDTFRSYFINRTGVDMSRDFFLEWLRLSSNLNDKVIDGVEETLDYLKSKDKKLVILSNWFTDVQVERLKKNGLLQYFDEVYGGDYDLKPREKAFLRAFGNTSKEKCVMIGDNYLKDFCGALNVGSNALHFNPNGEVIKEKQMIKRINEIKERY